MWIEKSGGSFKNTMKILSKLLGYHILIMLNEKREFVRYDVLVIPVKFLQDLNQMVRIMCAYPERVPQRIKEEAERIYSGLQKFFDVAEIALLEFKKVKNRNCYVLLEEAEEKELKDFVKLNTKDEVDDFN